MPINKNKHSNKTGFLRLLFYNTDELTWRGYHFDYKIFHIVEGIYHIFKWSEMEVAHGYIINLRNVDSVTNI